MRANIVERKNITTLTFSLLLVYINISINFLNTIKLFILSDIPSICLLFTIFTILYSSICLFMIIHNVWTLDRPQRIAICPNLRLIVRSSDLIINTGHLRLADSQLAYFLFPCAWWRGDCAHIIICTCTRVIISFDDSPQSLFAHYRTPNYFFMISTQNFPDASMH